MQLDINPYQMRNLEKYWLSATRIALHIDNGLNRIVDVQEAGETVVWSTVTFIASLPSEFILLAVKVHRSINSVKKVVPWDVRWKVDFMDNIVPNRDLNHNLSC